MDIYLTSKSSGRRLRIPLLPNRLSIKTAASLVTMNIIKQGTVKIPRGSEPTGYSWSGVFPSESLENAIFVFDWQEPARIVALIKEWEEAGETLQLMITDLSINADVFIESFSGDYYGVGDFSYTINLAVRRELIITTVPAPVVPSASGGITSDSDKRKGVVNVPNGGVLYIRSAPSDSATIVGKLKNGTKIDIIGRTGNWYIIKHNGKDAYVYASYVTITSGTAAPSTSSGGSSGSGNSNKSSGNNSGGNSSGTGSGATASKATYVVKKGDSLLTLAKTLLGSESRYLELYELNKGVLEQALKGTDASKYTLPIGVTLKLPPNNAIDATVNKAMATVNAAVNNPTKAAAAVVKTAKATVKAVVTSKPVATVVNAFKNIVNKVIPTKTTTTSKTTTTTVKKPSAVTKKSTSNRKDMLK